MSQLNDTAKRRIRWLTRRGLLELDIVLGQFMSREFDHLTDDELNAFVRLLDLPDPVFLALINQKEVCSDVDFIPLLEKIRKAGSGG
ncbi:succinate dehydrogenase assembly factor 2 [Neisseriaceae bacterium ESL0693]|nr:succinate dehydrogenase assembly factor 2 [Neisseriaceae bacterium ESL0693]